ncbi:MAG: lipid-binding SYLF domain-containing protein [Methylococcaceae bacterium]|nr:lipid-binding SYLF domain-containing protein [Methylococcaceae bacterium]MCI0733943.1 lipid-binding SYLF domain-containing protein [Methylococcaceae bacterium]
MRALPELAQLRTIDLANRNGFHRAGFSGILNTTVYYGLPNLTIIKNLCFRIGILLLLFGVNVTAAVYAADADELVSSAEVTLQHFRDDPEMARFRSLAKHAKGIFIAPKVWEAGVGIGGSGGKGVLFTLDKTSGQWLGPAFYSLGSASLGLQLGVQMSEIVLLVMNQNGINAMLASGLKLGAGASVAAGPVGKGAAVATADILSYSRSKGVYGGVSLNGEILAVNKELNLAYYGKPMDSVDILVRNSAPPAEKSLSILALVGRVSEGQ